MKNSRRTLMALVAVLLLSLAVAAPASFAQSGQDGYIQQGPSIVDRTGGDPPPSSSDELPFTGLDLGLIGVAGGSLLLLGMGMRRLTRAPDAV